MADIWFISDTHFSHENILKFKDDKGELIRGRFSSVSLMDEYMIEMWNDRVKPGDKVYHLGDVAFGSNLKIVKKLNGKKRLVVGNHDKINRELCSYFDKIMLWTGGKFKEHGFVCSHIPLREDQMRDAEINVHGHIHQNAPPSRRHICVCVEHTDYAPVHLDEIKAEILRRQV